MADPVTLLLTIYNDSIMKLAESFERAKRASSATAGDSLRAVHEQTKFVGDIASALLNVKEVEKFRLEKRVSSPVSNTPILPPNQANPPSPSNLYNSL